MIELKSNEDFFDADGNFDWDGYEATCPKVLRTPNPHIKTKDPSHKVFCREPYAQDLYNKMIDHMEECDIVTIVEQGTQYSGKIYSKKDTTATVDIGYRQLIFINLEKEDSVLVESLEVGSECDVTIISDPDNDGQQLTGSITEGMRRKTFHEMYGAIETQDTAWIGSVKKMMTDAGYMVNIKGIDCFMPGSLAGINKLHDFSTVLDKDLYVVPVSYSKDKGTIVVSHRAYLKTLIPETINELRDNLTQEITGTVTGSAKYGVFCEFNDCLTGMIHVNDLDPEILKRHKAREIKPGEEVVFRIKDIISNEKITLTQKDEGSYHNPWEDIDVKYKVPVEVAATVKSCKDYGLFIEIEDGVVGLLHVSEFENAEDLKDYKPKHKINVIVTRIEKETKKIFLKLPK
jgi:small subunit ribosomal protein S1